MVSFVLLRRRLARFLALSADLLLLAILFPLVVAHVGPRASAADGILLAYLSLFAAFRGAAAVVLAVGPQRPLLLPARRLGWTKHFLAARCLAALAGALFWTLLVFLVGSVAGGRFAVETLWIPLLGAAVFALLVVGVESLFRGKGVQSAGIPAVAVLCLVVCFALLGGNVAGVQLAAATLALSVWPLAAVTALLWIVAAGAVMVLGMRRLERMDL